MMMYTVTQRRCMLSSQPGTYSASDFLASVVKKKKRGKLKLEYAVKSSSSYSNCFVCILR